MIFLERASGKWRVIFDLSVLIWSGLAFVRTGDAVQKISFSESAIIQTVGFVQEKSQDIRGKTSLFVGKYLKNASTYEENIFLRKKISNLKKEIFNYRELGKENDRLKKLLIFGDKIKYKKVAAQVVAQDILGDQRLLRINRGFKDGIHLQAPVLIDKGLVGYIYRMTNNFSDVLTILDGQNRVDVMTARTRTRGILEGVSGSTCSMKYVARTEDIRLNDEVITSGLGNIYPKGIKVGTVSKIEKESYGVSQYIEVEISVDFSGIEEVIVVLTERDNKRKKEWERLNLLDD